MPDLLRGNCSPNNGQSKKIWTKRRCAIQGCTTAAGSGLPLHRFPRDDETLVKWLDATGVKTVSLQTIICGLHFKTSDYHNIDSAKRRLRRNAIPSLNLSTECDHMFDTPRFSDEEDDPMDSPWFGDNEPNEDEDSDVDKIRNLDCDPVPIDLCVRKLIDSEQDCLFVNEDVGPFAEDIEEEQNTVNIEPTNSEKQSVDKAVQTDKPSFMDFLKTDDHLKAFTGINFKVLSALEKGVNLISSSQIKKPVKYLCTVQEKIVLTLIKLKLCLSYECFGVLFNVSRSTISNYFTETIHLLHAVLEEAIYLPEQEEIRANLPLHFQNFQDTRIVLDCTEIPVENSQCLQCRMKMYSHYKGRQTLKFLIGIAPSGFVCFCSKSYGGRSSDKAIFKQSGLLDRLVPGQDAVMVDKGFAIDNECLEKNIKMYRPPFARGEKQMSKEDCLETRSIASARVHVERIMERLKNYSILKSVLDIKLTRYIDKIAVIICGLVNLSAPILDSARFCSA